MKKLHGDGVTFFDSPAGLMEIRVRAGRIESARFVRSTGLRPESSGRSPVIHELREYFRGVRRRFHVPLRLKGTPFQNRVWRTALKIPYGMTFSYKDVALKAEQPSGARAVAQALSRNPLAVFVPCHRVVPRNGKDRIGGYAWGRKRKRILLDLEHRTTSGRFRTWSGYTS